ncbi:hypothetical protein BVRB_4g091060 [Beta vulgaris subsp. vulgaris]|uniref:Uncharacterized protein n=1 Tax=Beta vulgaris subsp. vulgaris TaxID=3555 RepID=A0A0J8CGI5_BETVV|nr:hypothetical protein BVRB_4g091060 [Beta vulgaris subsp. vulgaris]
MGKSIILIHGLLSILLISLLQAHVVAVRKHYIVYLGSYDKGRNLLDDPEDITRTHQDMISTVSKKKDYDQHDSSNKLIYSYTKVFNAFAATLDEEEAKELASVWPESKSFSDEGFGPIPKKFKGRCENENDPTFKCNRTPTAKLTQTRTIVQTKPAPVVAEFSSKGPNTITPEILKPDILAPGVSIIAAWSQDPNATMSGAYFPNSGTSMAAPHVAGIAALLRKLYPHWTPSAIKSAIITTATPLDNSGMKMHEDDMVHEATPFGFGAGLVQPNQAMDPGLVYDMTVNDYIDFLCAHHFNNTVLELFTKQYAYKCPQSVNILDLNYPSITIPDFSGSASVTRKLKNVAQPATYKARIEAPPGISIIVEPNTLVYSKTDQEINFKLVFSSDVNHLPLDYQFGSLVWSDGKHVVRSPIVIKAKPRATPLKH